MLKKILVLAGVGLFFVSHAIANDYFSLVSACRGASAYVLQISITEGYGLEINPSHSERIEVFESASISIPLDNEWVELRATGVNPAPIQMLHFEGLATCETSASNEAAALTRQDVINAVLALKDRLGE